MAQISLSLNPHVQLHFHEYSETIPTITKDSSIESTFDIIFFAKVCKDKGIEDLLEALAIVKKKKPNITLHIIGYAGQSYLQHLIKMTKLLNIEANVKFLGFMASQQDVFKHAIHAKIVHLLFIS